MKVIICGLPAKRIMPNLHTQPPQETDDDRGSDVVELTRAEYNRAMGYLVRVEEDEEVIEPEFRILVQKLRNKEQRVRNQELHSAAMKRPKKGQGESSRNRSRRYSGT